MSKNIENTGHIEINQYSSNKKNPTVLYPKTTTNDVLNKSSNPILGTWSNLSEVLDALGTNAFSSDGGSGDNTTIIATPSINGLMSSVMVKKLNSIEDGAQVNIITGVKGDNEESYRIGQVNITAENIGLGNVENTADSEKSVKAAETAIRASQDINGQDITKTYVKTVERTENSITITKGDGTHTSFLISNDDNVIRYDLASNTSNGLMSSTHFTKLEGIEDGAQVNTITGIKGSNESTYRTGQVNITAENIGLGKVQNTADSEKTVKAAETAIKASEDSDGQVINKTYVKSIDMIDTQLSITKGDGSLSTIELPHIDNASNSVNGLMSSTHFTKLEGIESGAQVNTITGIKGDNESSYRIGQVNITAENIGLGKVQNTADSEKSVLESTKLKTSRLITLKGAINGSTSFDGSSDVVINNETVDGSKITGIIPISSIPHAALERCVIVQDENARLKLTKDQVQIGDTVKVKETNKMYFIVDESKLNSEEGYEIYTAGSASSVAWECITGKPESFPPTEHHHNYAGSLTQGGTAIKAEQDSRGQHIDATYLKNAEMTLSSILFTRGDDSTFEVSIDSTSGNEIKYDIASDSINGLMSSTHFTKLEGIEDGAQVNTITGIKGSNELEYRTGKVNITAENIGLGKVQNTADSEKTVKAAQSSVKASEDSIGQVINTTYIKTVEKIGNQVRVTKGDNSVSQFDLPLEGERYEIATISSSGLMSSTHFTKLEGIEDGAQVNTITGIKGSNESTYRTGQVNITAENIGLGNVENTADSEKTVKAAETATKALEDSIGHKIDETYVSDVVNDGNTIIISKGNGSRTSFEIPSSSGPIEYELASERLNGLMSSTHFTKLEKIQDGAQVNTITGVKGNNEFDYRTGQVNITAENIGLGNVENTADSEKTVKAAETAIKASQDSRGQDISETYIKSITLDDHTFTITNGNDKASSFILQDKDTTYKNATTSSDGLMSSTHFTKLEGIESGAQVNTITGIKGNNELDYRTGQVNITAESIGLGKVQNTADSEKTVKAAETAIKAVQDDNGQIIVNTYVKAVTLSGNTIIITKGDNTKSTFTIPAIGGVLKPGTPTESGLTKLFNTTGSAEDGAMTQKSITEELAKYSKNTHEHNYASSTTPGGPASSALECTGNSKTATEAKHSKSAGVLTDIQPDYACLWFHRLSTDN